MEKQLGCAVLGKQSLPSCIPKRELGNEKTNAQGGYRPLDPQLVFTQTSVCLILIDAL